VFQLLSHLSHLEIASPDVEASVAFYERQFGLSAVDRDEDGSVYLRCWGDYYRYSLIVSPGPQPALVNKPGAPRARKRWTRPRSGSRPRA
jgi:catechol 2,3-dioxygenase